MYGGLPPLSQTSSKNRPFSFQDIGASLPDLYDIGSRQNSRSSTQLDLGWKKQDTSGEYRSGWVNSTTHTNESKIAKIESIKYSTSSAFNYGNTLTIIPRPAFTGHFNKTMQEGGFNPGHGSLMFHIKDKALNTNIRGQVDSLMQSVQKVEQIPPAVLANLSLTMGISLTSKPYEVPSLESLCEQIIVADPELYQAVQEAPIASTFKTDLAEKAKQMR